MKNTRKEIYMYVLGAIVVCLFIGLIGVMLFAEMPAANEKVVYMMTGIVGSGFLLVLQYFYGSSKSSSDKTQIMTDENRQRNEDKK